MAEEIKTQFRQEGDNAFPADKGEETPAAPSAEKKPEAEKGTEGDQEVPFHKRPEWSRREKEWNDKFADQERRHKEELARMTPAEKKEEKRELDNSKQPMWFGGTQEQWDAFRADRQREIAEAEDRAAEKAYKRFTGEISAQEKAQQEAQEYLNTEIDAIEADTDLNPDGAKIDRAALLKFTLDNDLVNSKGQWNYRKAYELMQAKSQGNKQKSTEERKKVAAATTSERKAEAKPATAKTAQDFKGNRRPW